MGFLHPVACAALLLQLGVSASAFSVVRYSDFGAKGDGKTDDFEALANAHTYANEKDLPGPCLITVTDKSVLRFIRRGVNQNNGRAQTDSFLVDGNGQIDPKTPIIWDFDQISSMEARPTGALSISRVAQT